MPPLGRLVRARRPALREWYLNRPAVVKGRGRLVSKAVAARAPLPARAVRHV